MNDENCGFLDYYAASSGNFLQKLRTTYRSYLQESRIQKRNGKMGPMLSRNVGKELPLLAV
jgi:hypothetical protein